MKQQTTFCILIKSKLSNQEAVNYCKNLIKDNHKINCLFFYSDGVLNAIQTNEFATHWSLFASSNKLPLTVCSTAIERRAIKETSLASGFSLSGLGQFMEAVCNSDKLVEF